MFVCLKIIIKNTILSYRNTHEQKIKTTRPKLDTTYDIFFKRKYSRYIIMTVNGALGIIQIYKHNAYV